MYSWNERVTGFLSLNNASYIFSSLVWLYDANRLVVPSHTFLWENIGYVPTNVLIYKLVVLQFVFMERTSNLFSLSK